MTALYAHLKMGVRIVIVYLLNTPVSNPTASVATVSSTLM